jgi:hypothetical protein
LKRTPFKVDDDSTLFVKECRPSCKSSEVLNRKPCKCKKESGIVVCFSYYTLAVFRNRPSGECGRKKVVVRVPCQHDCLDAKPKQTCQRYVSNNLCGRRDVKKSCPFTCGVKKCQCDGTVKWEGECKASQNRRVIVKLQYKKRFGMCTIQITKNKRQCEVKLPQKCSGKKLREKLVVFPCIGGSRYEFKVKYTNKKEVCTRSVNKVLRQCHACPTCLDEEFTPCQNGRRQRIKYWFNRVNDCCKRKKYVEDLACSRCPDDQVINGTCRMGLQIVRRYIWYRVDGKCILQTIPRLQRCT